MATTNLYLDMRGKAKDGKGSVLIVISHNRTTTSIPTGIRVCPSNWNKDTKKVVKLSTAEALNATLQLQKAKVDEAIALLSLGSDRMDGMTAAEIKSEVFTKKEKKPSGHLVSDLFAEYVQTGGLKKSTRDIYDIALMKVLNYGGERLKIEDINLAWLRGFDQYLSQSQSVNGKSIYLRAFRAVCNYARNNDIIFSYPFSKFQIKSVPTQKRSVPVEKLREFLACPTNQHNVRYRDFFFLMFYLIGINAKDLFLAKKTQVVKGRLEYVREKTGKKYSIRIEPEASELLAKYCGKAGYLLNVMDTCKDYKNFVHEMNDALGTIGYVEEETVQSDSLFELPQTKMVLRPVIPGLTTYYSRHCWATYAYEIGIPMDTISQALGHSFGNRTTLIYVKPDQDKVDDANRRVIDFLLRY